MIWGKSGPVMPLHGRLEHHHEASTSTALIGGHEHRQVPFWLCPAPSGTSSAQLQLQLHHHGTRHLDQTHLRSSQSINTKQVHSSPSHLKAATQHNFCGLNGQRAPEKQHKARNLPSTSRRSPFLFLTGLRPTSRSWQSIVTKQVHSPPLSPEGCDAAAFLRARHVHTRGGCRQGGG